MTLLLDWIFRFLPPPFSSFVVSVASVRLYIFGGSSKGACPSVRSRSVSSSISGYFRGFLRVERLSRGFIPFNRKWPSPVCSRRIMLKACRSIDSKRVLLDVTPHHTQKNRRVDIIICCRSSAVSPASERTTSGLLPKYLSYSDRQIAYVQGDPHGSKSLKITGP